MPGSEKIQGVPVQQCQFSPSITRDEEGLSACSKSIGEEKTRREAQGETCSVYMDVFGDANGSNTVLTLVCEGKKPKPKRKRRYHPPNSYPPPNNYPPKPDPSPFPQKTKPPKAHFDSRDVIIPSGPELNDRGMLIFLQRSEPVLDA
ncbi:MAG: hypothetical protein U1F66_04005 [bacterium]